MQSRSNSDDLLEGSIFSDAGFALSAVFRAIGTASTTPALLRPWQAS
jgi:hypothetical protein